jgi:hypothetical protein
MEKIFLLFDRHEIVASSGWRPNLPRLTNNTDSALRSSIAVVALSLSSRIFAASFSENLAALAMDVFHGKNII